MFHLERPSQRPSCHYGHCSKRRCCKNNAFSRNNKENGKKIHQWTQKKYKCASSA
nr:MAG TPA: hypothetical protein [Caudoviricetes sp.]